MMVELEYGDVVFFVEGGKLENPGKSSRSRDENQQQTQPTYARNGAWATLVGGERSRHYTIPAPQTVGKTVNLGWVSKVRL